MAFKDPMVEKELVIESNQTFAIQQLGMKLNKTKVLGLSWKKVERFARCRITIRNQKAY